MPSPQGKKSQYQTMIKILRRRGPIAKVLSLTMIMTLLTMIGRHNERHNAVLDEAMIRSALWKEQEQKKLNTTITLTQLEPQQQQPETSLSSSRTIATGNSGIRSTLPRIPTLTIPKRRPKKQVKGAGSLEPPWTVKADPNTIKFVVNPQSDAASQSLFQKQPEHSPGSKILTFFLMYYNDVDHLAHQLASWLKFPKETKDKVQFLIVDDGSAKDFRAVDVLQAQSNWKDPDIDIVVYEVEQDLAWNIGGARNLGFFLAATDWVFLSDADTLVEPETMEYIFQKMNIDIHCKHCIYRKFHRLRADNITFKPHPAAMVLTKAAYWAAGGCDEDFVGSYGQTDIHFFRRAEQVTALKIMLLWEEMMPGVAPPLKELPDEVACPPGITCIPRFDKSTWEDRPSRDIKNNQIMLRRKSRGRVPWTNEYLRFRWQRVW